MMSGFCWGSFLGFFFSREERDRRGRNVFLQFLHWSGCQLPSSFFPSQIINPSHLSSNSSNQIRVREDSMYICMPLSQFDFTPLVSRNCKIATQRKKPEKSQNSIGSIFLKPKIWFACFVDFLDQTGGLARKNVRARKNATSSRPGLWRDASLSNWNFFLSWPTHLIKPFCQMMASNNQFKSNLKWYNIKKALHYWPPTFVFVPILCLIYVCTKEHDRYLFTIPIKSQRRNGRKRHMYQDKIIILFLACLIS